MRGHSQAIGNREREKERGEDCFHELKSHLKKAEKRGNGGCLRRARCCCYRCCCCCGECGEEANAGKELRTM